MKNSLLAVTALGLVLAVSGLAESQSGTRYRAFKIKNSTPAHVNYQVRWGNGEWTSFAAAPGHTIVHRIPYSGARTPVPYVRWDWTLNDTRLVILTYQHHFQDVAIPSHGPMNHWIRYRNTAVYLLHASRR